MNLHPDSIRHPDVLFLEKLVKVEVDALYRRVKELEKRVDSLGSTVPPGSDSALREGEDADMERWRLQGDLARSQQSLQMAVRLKLKAQGELDAANQHVKILEESRASQVAACLRSCAQTITENRWCEVSAAHYLNKYADTVLAQAPPTSGPPIPDLAAQPDSNTEPCIEEAYQAINRLHRIGVYDYASCVSCLRDNYKRIFGDDAPLTDPQDMIQHMAAEIQGLRRELAAIRSQA